MLVIKNFNKQNNLSKKNTFNFFSSKISYLNNFKKYFKGDYFDLAVQSLALALKKNLISGGTFASSLTVDFFKAGGQPCYLCVTDGLKPDVVEKLHPKNIIKFKDLLFIPRDNNPVGQSNIFLCSTCANFMTSIFVNDLFGDEDYKAIQRYFFIFLSKITKVLFIL